MEQVTNTGIMLMVLITDVLIIGGVALILLIARSMSARQPGNSHRIIRVAYIISTTIAIVFGVLAETILVLTVLWTVGLI